MQLLFSELDNTFDSAIMNCFTCSKISDETKKIFHMQMEIMQSAMCMVNSTIIAEQHSVALSCRV